MDLVNRLKLFLERRQIAISQFADTCRIPRPTVSQILNGRNKKISDELITKIHDAYPDLSVLWLMFGEGEMDVNANKQFSEALNEPKTGSAVPNGIGSQPFAATELSFEDDTENGAEKFPDLFSSTMAVGQAPLAQNSGENGAPRIEPAVSSEKSSDGNMRMADGSNYKTDGGNYKADGGSQRMSPIVTPQNDGTSITFKPESFKKITNIVVFYNDNSFESFSPSPA